MTTREVVQELRKSGHKIKYKVRKDGGILITSIDGVKYKGAAGNTMARAMLGERASLSKKRMTQLKIIKPTKGRKPKIPLPQAIEEKVKTVQKLYNKNKVPIEQGRITKKLIRDIIEKEGKQAAYTKLERAEKYASGFATSSTIQALLDYIGSTMELVSNEDKKLLEDLKVDILLNEDSIKDEWIKPAYDVLYDINKGRDIRDVVMEVRRILHI